MNKEKIWFGNPVIADLDWMKANSLSESLDIKITEINDDHIIGTMPVDSRTKQPFGLLHGGASVALAETLGSIASLLVVNQELFMGVGIEINANHIKAVYDGLLKAICKPVHIKGSTHIWEIKIYNENGDLSCISRFTCAIVLKSKMQNKK